MPNVANLGEPDDQMFLNTNVRQKCLKSLSIYSRNPSGSYGALLKLFIYSGVLKELWSSRKFLDDLFVSSETYTYPDGYSFYVRIDMQKVPGDVLSLNQISQETFSF